jgi:hypothetical protein
MTLLTPLAAALDVALLAHETARPPPRWRRCISRWVRRWAWILARAGGQIRAAGTLGPLGLAPVDG